MKLLYRKKLPSDVQGLHDPLTREWLANKLLLRALLNIYIFRLWMGFTLNSYPNGKKMNMVQLVTAKCVKGELSIEQWSTGRAHLQYELIFRLGSNETVNPIKTYCRYTSLKYGDHSYIPYRNVIYDIALYQEICPTYILGGLNYCVLTFKLIICYNARIVYKHVYTLYLYIFFNTYV